MRLDRYLAESSLVDSRTDAQRFIVEGAVTVNDKVIKKPSFEVLGTEKIEVDKSGKRYVSRGGLKLEAAIESFKIIPSGKLALDVGASSGGFTDCLLQHGAKHVIAVDSGCGQIVESLRQDKRVTVIENYNARYMKRTDFDYTPEIAVMDVSFISAKMIIPSVYDVLADGGEFICLIKPQFEVGRGGLNKKGIVKNESLRSAALNDVIDFASHVGFLPGGVIESPIRGGDGNVEFLVCFKKT